MPASPAWADRVSVPPAKAICASRTPPRSRTSTGRWHNCANTSRTTAPNKPTIPRQSRRASINLMSEPPIDARLDSFETRLDTVANHLGSIDGRLSTIENRVDALDHRFGALDRRFDALDRRVTRGFERVDQRFDALTAEMRRGFDELGRALRRRGPKREV